VLFWHGVFDSSDAWIMHYPDVAAGFVVARAGYDVWFGNSRGNKYSTAHTTLDVTSKEFWEYDFEQMGDYDVPAVIEHI
jgi:lysosomal acid lipase/cholesteryl ester hydrolase